MTDQINPDAVAEARAFNPEGIHVRAVEYNAQDNDQVRRVQVDVFPLPAGASEAVAEAMIAAAHAKLKELGVVGQEHVRVDNDGTVVPVQ